jgi:hypothetical protein
LRQERQQHLRTGETVDISARHANTRKDCTPNVRPPILPLMDRLDSRRGESAGSRLPRRVVVAHCFFSFLNS